MLSKSQSAQERIAKLQAITDPDRPAPPKPAAGKPLTWRPTADLRTWCVHEAARQAMATGEPVTVQDVVTEAVEAMRAARGG